MRSVTEQESTTWDGPELPRTAAERVDLAVSGSECQRAPQEGSIADL
jgi:hypothetical protein